MERKMHGKKSRVRDGIKSFRDLNWGESLKNSLKFSVDPKRILQFLVLDMAALFAVMMIAGQDTLLLAMISYTEGMLPTESMYMMAGVMTVFAIWFIVNLWISGAMVFQSKNKEKYKESWKLSLSRLYPLFMVLVTMSLFSLVVSFVPYIGAILGMVVALAFLFGHQFIMLDSAGFVDSVRRSVHTFKENILSVFATWIFVQVITSLIMLVFLTPMLMFSLSLDPDYGSEDVFLNTYLFADTPVLAGLASFFLLGMSISRVFTIKFVTDIFLQFKKKKWLAT